MKLKAETRFLNAIDSNIYDAGDTFEVKDEQAEYFVQHKLAYKVKEEKVKEDTKELKEPVKTKAK